MNGCMIIYMSVYADSAFSYLCFLWSQRGYQKLFGSCERTRQRELLTVVSTERVPKATTDLFVHACIELCCVERSCPFWVKVKATTIISHQLYLKQQQQSASRNRESVLAVDCLFLDFVSFVVCALLPLAAAEFAAQASLPQKHARAAAKSLLRLLNDSCL